MKTSYKIKIRSTKLNKFKHAARKHTSKSQMFDEKLKKLLPNADKIIEEAINYKTFNCGFSSELIAQIHELSKKYFLPTTQVVQILVDKLK